MSLFKALQVSSLPAPVENCYSLYPPHGISAYFSSLCFVTTHLALYFPDTWNTIFSFVILLLLILGTSPPSSYPISLKYCVI